MEQEAQADILAEQMRDSLNRVNPALVTVYDLMLEEMSMKEIAQVMRVSPAAISQKVAQIRKILARFAK
jgi:DNA-directed RNA polymerase specialized sigma subunit